MCLLMNLMSLDVSSFRINTPNKALKPCIVKNVISQMLEALMQLHNLDIVYTVWILAPGTLNCKVYSICRMIYKISKAFSIQF